MLDGSNLYSLKLFHNIKFKTKIDSQLNFWISRGLWIHGRFCEVTILLTYYIILI